MNKKQRRNKAIDLISNAKSHLNESLNKLNTAIDHLENPFQTRPQNRFINMIVSICDPEGNSHKSYNEQLDFKWEINPAFLYIALKEMISHYSNSKYKMFVTIQDIEEWLNNMKGLAFTADLSYDGFIPEEGLTIAKGDMGEDESPGYYYDFFIEYVFEPKGF